MKIFLRHLKNDERGQGMVEYALIIALIALLLIGSLTLLRGGIGGVFEKITEATVTTGAISITI